MANVINWFEVPALDFDRAKKFYETILGGDIYVSEMMGVKMGFFNMGEDQNGIGGALCYGEEYKPSLVGTKVYFNANPDLAIALSKVEEAGGKIVLGKTLITEEYGYMAFIVDTEGNFVGLHSSK